MKTTSKPKAKKSGKLKSSSIFSGRLVLSFVIAFAAVGAYLIISANAAKPVNNVVALSLSPTSQRLNVNQTITVEVRLNTNNQTVNAVQADMTYAADKFEFVSIDATTSAFDIEAPSSGGNGTVSVIRGSITPLNSSNLLVGRVNFRAIASGRKLPITFASSSQVIRAEDSVNILQKMSGGQYTIQ
jgi:hypothetical protein